jgi:hypothetical protein
MALLLNFPSLLGSDGRIITNDEPILVKALGYICKAAYGDRIGICDNVADEVQVNACIVAVNAAGGGDIKFGPGTLTTSDSIRPMSNVHLKLSPGTTITIPNAVPAGWGIIEFRGPIDGFSLNNFSIEGGNIDGNLAGQLPGVIATAAPPNNTIFNGITISVSIADVLTVTNCRIENVRLVNIIGTPILVGQGGGMLGAELCSNNWVILCSISGQYIPAPAATWHDSIYIGGGGWNVVFNTIADASDDCIAQEYGDGALFAYNICENAYNNGIAINGRLDIIGNKITLSGARGGSGDGIFISTGGGGLGSTPTYGHVCDNQSWSNARHGLNGRDTQYYSISHNTFWLNGCCGLVLHDDVFDNLIDANISVDNSQALDIGYDNIQFQTNCDFNLISNNVCRYTGLAARPRYGIHIVNNTCDFNMVHGNNLYSSGATGDIQDNGTNTRKRDNLGNAGAWLPDV